MGIQMSDHLPTSHTVPSVTAQVRRLAIQLLMGALVCIALWTGAPSPARAQQPTGAAEQAIAQTQLAPASSPHAFTPSLWIYLLAIGAALIMGGIYMVHRARQRHLYDIEEDAFAPRRDRPPRREVQPADPLMSVATQLSADQSSPHALAIQRGAERPLFALRTDGHAKECPACHRNFASWMAVCPVDATPLEDLIARRRAGRSAKGKTALQRLRCPSCERRFAEDARLCPYDGLQLVRDTAEEAAVAPPTTICRSCGADVTDALGRICHCGEDFDPLTLDPSDVSNRPPAVPLTVCPRCRAWGSFGQTHCPHDGELLMPVTELEANALPATGYGPRRKVCRTCGVHFSGAYLFCSFDGTELTSIH